ncbi:hypothetical protein [Alkalihalobacterium bogoriense]|uniref:hypothetical protein n=1 Tax=Alkalihalobacterium bogoriense TaxID=246272 RepID=UPI00047DBFC4|nr:hypothetical protein [Alkalihalobacterium bogoriense]
MTKDESLTVFKLLKKLGLKSEKHLQQYVQSILADEDFMKLMNQLLNKHVTSIKDLHRYTETIAVQLNVPTKRDVAQLAKLAQQIEEKIDDLEEQVMELTVQEDEGETMNQHGKKESQTILGELLDVKAQKRRAKLKAIMDLWANVPASPIRTNGMERERKHD